jgi:hypothetical protein
MTQPLRKNSHEILVFSVNGDAENRSTEARAEVLIQGAVATC